MKRALELTTNVFTIFAAWLIVTSIGPFLSEQPEIGLFNIAVGLVCAVIAWGAWMLNNRHTPREARSRDVRLSRNRSETGLLLMIPVGVGALLNFAGAGWTWTIAGGLIAAVWVVFAITELERRLVPGDCITIDRGGGFQLAKVVNVVHDDSGNPFYDLILFSPPSERRPVLELSNIPEDDDLRFPKARMSWNALWDAEFAIAAPAHSVVDAKLDGLGQAPRSNVQKTWSPPQRQDG